MRVLTVINSLATGGAETLVCNAGRALTASGCTEVAIAVLYPQLDEAWRLDDSSIRLMSLGMRGKRDLLSGARRLQEEIETFQPDVVHTHLFPADAVTVLATRRGRSDTARVLSEHVETNRRRELPFGRRIDGWTYGHFDRIICVSSVVDASLSRWLPALRDRNTVLQNAVELSAHQWNARGPFTADIAFVGRLFDQKGLDILIEAMSVLRSRGQSITLEVIGEGPKRGEYERLVERLNLERQVRFVGRRPNALASMHHARALVLPSRYEGLSMVMLEAMSLAMPVVATAVSGASEVIRDGWSGYLVRPMDAEALAGGIMTALSDDEAATRVGLNARESVARTYSMDAYAKRLRALYEEVIAGRRTTRLTRL